MLYSRGLVKQSSSYEASTGKQRASRKVEGYQGREASTCEKEEIRAWDLLLEEPISYDDGPSRCNTTAASCPEKHNKVPTPCSDWLGTRRVLELGKHSSVRVSIHILSTPSHSRYIDGSRPLGLRTLPSMRRCRFLRDLKPCAGGRSSVRQGFEKSAAPVSYS